ncbi:uncharacterized protein LOC134815643 isoform X2 [Bolinopsis microptera]|uniref:uncharacterized protein LOC134815643 isoform X2 n=1 Tax=Bolinopsis microptera TaxID=2820187 RepID=UPI00307AB49B
MTFKKISFRNSFRNYRKEFSKEFTKNPEVIVHASSTSRLFEMLNSKTSKKDRKIGLGVTTNGGCRSLNDIMSELNSSIASLDSAGHSEDNSSLFDGSSYTTGGSMTESMAEIAAEDLITAMRTQRAHLLERRAEMQMRVIHLENEEAAIITGQRIHEVAGLDWSRKHINTGFLINNPSEGISSMDEVSQLEFDVEIQKKIVHAARRLAREHGIGRSAKRERKMATQRALLKLQELERKLQSAKRFQRPCNPDTSDSEKQKLHEHQTYYKAVTDNGYYPHFRTVSSSTSEDKVSGYDPTESDWSTPLSPGFCDNQQPSRHSSSSSIGTNCQDSVRASLQLTLLDDTITKTQPRKRSDTRGSITPQNSVNYEPTSPVTPPHSAKSKSFFNTSFPFRIESLAGSISGSRRQDNMNKVEPKQMQFRPRAGSYKQPDVNNVSTLTRCHDNVIPEKITNSYEKYLQTLRVNRQRNELVNRNFENRRHSCSDWQDNNVTNYNGHTSNGHMTNGHTSNGHMTNGHMTNGHMTNGHMTNGHMSNGHMTNGTTSQHSTAV